MASLSVCMIVKNAAKTIQMSMSTAILLGDEVIVSLDDSTTDNTLELIKTLEGGTPIHIFPYSFQDFGKARNDCISHASCEWVLMLDADETITTENIEKIKAFLATNPRKIVYGLPRHKWTDSSFSKYVEAEYPDIQWRLIPNNGTVSYNQLIHETPFQPSTGNVFTALRDIHLEHHQYTLTHQERHDKQQFYMVLWAKQHPNTPYPV